MNTFLSDLARFVSLQDANTRTVVLGACALGVACGVVGCLATLRRRALLGDAVAHAALPGVCAAFFVVQSRSFAALMLGALVFGALAAGLVALVRAWTRVREDAAIGIAIGSFFGLGVVWSGMISRRPEGAAAGLDGFIFGKAASMTSADVFAIGAVAAACLAVVALFYKEFKALTFDEEFAAAQGWPTVALDLLVMALVCACTVAGLPAVGVVMVVALLVIPPAAARCWTDRLGVLLLLAGGIGLFAAVVGVGLSATLPAPRGALTRGWPTGPLIVLVAAAVFVVGALLSPRRGVLAQARRRRVVEAPPP
ncbi:MAG: metal ABC transporter permease [Phycisphaeraceae bacterium]|nr:metal ABC transporter permease [Phycisphaeraceae bacterium]